MGVGLAVPVGVTVGVALGVVVAVAVEVAEAVGVGLGGIVAVPVAEGVGDKVGLAVGVDVGVPLKWHSVTLTLSTRQPSLEPLVSLAIRQRRIVKAVGRFTVAMTNPSELPLHA